MDKKKSYAGILASLLVGGVAIADAVVNGDAYTEAAKKEAEAKRLDAEAKKMREEAASSLKSTVFGAASASTPTTGTVLSSVPFSVAENYCKAQYWKDLGMNCFLTNENRVAKIKSHGYYSYDVVIE